MPLTFTCIVRGQVQGVGFRYFTRNKALELQLTGWVRNLPDGSVEIMASGPLRELEQLLQYLRTGPIGSQVDQVDFQWLPEPQVHRGFEIRG